MKCGPCKECQERAVGCHVICEQYLEWKKLVDLEREARNEQTGIAYQITSMTQEKWLKWKRSHR